MSTEHKLPPELGEIFDAIHNDMIHLHATWDVYEELFTSQDVIDSMNKLCPFVARTIQDSLLDGVLLSITRLCDHQRGKNLTFKHLIKHLDPPADFTKELYECLNKINTAIEPFIQHRHKRIAHTDLDHALADNANLPTFSRSSVEETLSLIREFMNKINIRYRFAPTLYEETQVIGGEIRLYVYSKWPNVLSRFVRKSSVVR